MLNLQNMSGISTNRLESMGRVFLSTLLFACMIAFCSAERPDQAFERTETVQRRPLTSNTPGLVYRELRDPAVIKSLLKVVGGDAVNAVFSVVFGGDDSGFTVSIHVLETTALLDRAIQAVTLYAQLRWLGISRESALKLIGETNQKTSPQNELTSALHRAAPWLPYKRLRPILAAESLAIFWTEDGKVFVFKDKEISFVIDFQKRGETFEALLYCVDSKEFEDGTRTTIAECAKNAGLKVDKLSGSKSPRSAVAFWRELKRLLNERGVAWLSPEELNPDYDWH